MHFITYLNKIVVSPRTTQEALPGRAGRNAGVGAVSEEPRSHARQGVVRGSLCFFPLVFFLFTGCGPKDMKPVKKPVKKPKVSLDKKSLLKLGQMTFEYYCTGCHGLYGRGNGPQAKSILKIYKVGTANLAASNVQKETNTRLRRVIAYGGKHEGLSKFMPTWGKTLTGDEIDAVIEYIRLLPSIHPPSVFAAGEPKSLLEREIFGRETFVNYCAPCHGLDRTGKGPYWKKLKKEDPNFPAPPDFTNREYMRVLSDEQIQKTIRAGVHDPQKTIMPSWERKLSQEEILDLIAYIRSL